jgi:hypothetical protein
MTTDTQAYLVNRLPRLQVILVLLHVQKKVNKLKSNKAVFNTASLFYFSDAVLQQNERCKRTAVSPDCLASIQSGSANARKMLDHTYLRETYRNLSSSLFGQRVTLLHSTTPSRLIWWLGFRLGFGGPRLQFRLGHRLTCLTLFVIFFSFSEEMSRQYLD